MSELLQDRETATLQRYLNAQREHVLGILDGLDEEALRRPVLPSGWTCLGMVQHLALDVERFWFGAVVAADRTVIESLDGTGDAWQVDPDRSSEAVFNEYREICARADEIIQTTSPDAAPTWWPGDLFGDFRLDTAREIILHVVAETANHAGHLDVARELIDGRLWLVLDV